MNSENRMYLSLVSYLQAFQSPVRRLEPILSRIKEERRAVLMPTIDAIDANTLAYQGVPYASSVGSFWW